MPELARRRLEGGQQFFPLHPAKVLTHHPGGGDKRCRMHLAAAVAVAVADRHVQAANLIAHRFTKATSVEWVSHKVGAGHGRVIIIAYNSRLRIV